MPYQTSQVIKTTVEAGSGMQEAFDTSIFHVRDIE